MGTKFLPTALLGNGNTSLSYINPLLKCIAIHLGNPKRRHFVPIYHPCLLEMPGFPEIMTVSFPSLHSFWEWNDLEGWKRSFDQESRDFDSSLNSTSTSAWLWRSLMSTRATTISFYFCSYFHLLDFTVRILHLVSHSITTSPFKVGIYHHHFIDKKTEGTGWDLAL